MFFNRDYFQSTADLNNVFNFQDKNNMSVVRSDPSTFNIVHYNIRSLRHKFEELSIVLDKLFDDKRGHLDVLCVSETWLDKGTVVNIPGFDHVSSYVRTDRIGGGVSLFIRRGIPVTEFVIPNAGREGFEVAGVTLGKNRDLLVICIYRPPDMKLESFLFQLEYLLNICTTQYEYVIVGGDFNVDCTQRRSGNAVKLLQSMQSFNFVDLITGPTRVTNFSSSRIDNFFINFDASLCRSENLHLGLSDHLAQAIYVLPPVGPSCKNYPKLIMKRFFTVEAKDKFSDFLLKSDWQDIYSAKNVEKKFQIFLEGLQNGYNMAFPLKLIKAKNTIKKFKWQSPELQSLCSKKRDLELLVRLYRDNTELKEMYKNLKQKIKDKIKQLKTGYAENIIAFSKNKTKNAWELIKNEIRHPSKPSFHQIERNGKKVYRMAAIANEFNRYFTNPDLNIAASLTDPLSYVPLVYEGPILQEFRRCSQNDLQKIVDSIKCKTSAGYDDISSSVLKEFFPLMRDVVLHMCQESLTSGVFPSCLKRARVIPIYKKGPKIDVQNYRPIAVLPSISKILEKIVYRDLIDHFQGNNILSRFQFGFQKNKSTTEAITEYINTVFERLDKGERGLGVFLDLQKAFDSVDHVMLLTKLRSYGVSGTVLCWLRSYLYDRSQFVEISGRLGQVENAKVFSEVAKVRQGVPQGSILGPLLFLVFLNDLPLNIEANYISLFADDSSFLVSSSDYKTLYSKCQILLNDLEQWFSENKLMVNVKKSFLISFTLSNRHRDGNINNYPLSMFESVLQEAENTRFLGVIIDKNLTWTEQILGLCGRLRSTQFILHRLREFLPKKTLLMYYYACVESVLRYGIILWGAGSQIIRVFRVQKSILRILCGRRARSSCRGLFRDNNILTVPGLYILELGIYAFKNRESWTAGLNVHSYNTRQNEAIRLETHRTKRYESTPCYISKKVYNNLPGGVRSVERLDVFKIKLKQWLCEREFYSVNDLFENNFLS
jgi:hypothetical protein